MDPKSIVWKYLFEESEYSVQMERRCLAVPKFHNIHPTLPVPGTLVVVVEPHLQTVERFHIFGCFPNLVSSPPTKLRALNLG